jgi:hypothetical protein
MMDARCVAVQMARGEAQNAAGVNPGKALQRRGWSFGLQPVGNVVKKPPLRVAGLGQADAWPSPRALIGAFLNMFALASIV